MQEVTHISYGEGTVNIALDSTNLTDVSGPEFRFGDYKSVVTSCFTPMELNRISEGESADLTFHFVVSEELEDEALCAQFLSAIEEEEKEVGHLNEGLHVEINANKSVGNGSTESFETTAEDMELQIDIPMYLSREGRSYYYLTSNMGECSLLADESPEAEVLTINTKSLGKGVLLYQDSIESLVGDKNPVLNIKSQYLFAGGIVILVFFWLFLEHLRQKNS